MKMKPITFPFAVCLVIYATSLFSSSYFFDETWFRTTGPGGDPPWYFIGRSLVDAACAVPGLLAMLAFSFLTFRRRGPDVWTALAILVLSLLHPLTQGVNILLHTRYAWDPARATSEWANYEMYSASRYQAFLVTLVLSLLVLGALWYFRRKSEPSGPAI
jgi:branched-subunit amino acid ABC-type transport system permease component